MIPVVAKRIQTRLDALGKSARKASIEAGLGPDAIHNILRGKSARPRRSTLGKLTSPLKCSIEYLIGEDDYPGDTVGSSGASGGLPVYLAVRSISPITGSLDGYDDDAAEGEVAYFPERLIYEELRARPDHLRVMEIEGQSMEPALCGGDQVLVDSSRTNPSQPGLFVLWDGHGLVAKWVERVSQSDPPRLRVISENALFKPYEVAEAEAQILGRVVWFARRL
jgi:transcriptional regulator with XRE-family HTH domain